MTGITAGREPQPGRAAQIVEQEYESVLAAILLVGSGRSPRVTIANLRFAELVVPRLRDVATDRGVRLVPLWTTDEGWPRDIAVEPAGSDA